MLYTPLSTAECYIHQSQQQNVLYSKMSSRMLYTPKSAAECYIHQSQQALICSQHSAINFLQ